MWTNEVVSFKTQAVTRGDGMEAKDWIALYAAVVSTTAFFLNFRSWHEGQPRLRLSLMVDAMAVGGGQETDEKNLIVLTVTNRGKEPTVITHMVVFRMSTWLRRLLRKPDHHMVVPHPYIQGQAPNIPYELKSANIWHGIARNREDVFGNIYDGTYYVGVYASHRNKPYLKRIKRSKNMLSQKSPEPPHK